jgi:hypothetical protein
MGNPVVRFEIVGKDAAASVAGSTSISRNELPPGVLPANAVS